jgi:Tfp pilus assembly protein PilN
MIEINLLPEELKVKTRRIGVTFEKKQILLILPFILGTLICVHIYLAALFITKNNQLRLLNNRWKDLEPQRKELEDFNKEYGIESADTLILIQRLLSQRINWSEKLNKLSLHLPSGIWFNEISITSDGFTLQGSVISLAKDEMGLINRFFDSLKNDSSFFGDFSNMELTSVQKKIIGGYDITDFVLQGALKIK